MRIYPLYLFLLLLSACGSETSTSASASDPSTLQVAGEGFQGQLFELLKAEQTGIDFANNTIQTYDFNFVQFGYLINGAGVAVLDYDLDDKPDIFFVSNQEDNRLYRNLGDFKFEDVSEAAGLTGYGGFHTGASVVDINQDGYPDVYVSRNGIDNTAEGAVNRTNLLFINQKDGTFKEEAATYGLNSSHPSTQAAFFDYDNDGDLDCYLVNTPTDYMTTHKIRVAPVASGGYRRLTGPKESWESDQFFRNDNGRFVDVSAAAGINNRAWGLSAAVFDFNNDGLQDIFVGNDYVEPDYVYINQGDGTFKEQANQYFRHMSHNTMGSDIADVNNDGLLDIFCVDMLSDSNQRRKELETLMMPDRYATLVNYGYQHQVMWNVLQLNNGNGSFSEVGSMAGIASTDWSWSPLFADFDNDLFPDLHITNGYRYDITNIDYLQHTADSINRMGGVTPDNFPTFNDYLDLVPTQRVPNFIYRNLGDLNFEDLTIPWGMGQPSYSGGSAYADFDGDGDLDLVVNNMHEPAFVYRNRLNESDQAPNYLQVVAKGAANNPLGQGLHITMRAGGHKLVRELYPARGFQSSSQLIAQFGLGDIEQIDELVFEWPDGRNQVLRNVSVNQRLVADHAQSSRRALPVADAGSPMVDFPADQRGLTFVHQENDFDDFDREFLLPRKLSREGPALATADVNGDGTEDIFLGGAAGQASHLYLQNANGYFGSPDTTMFLSENFQEDVAAAFFDADGDGDQDLYVVSGGNAFPLGSTRYQDRLYINNGAGSFSLATGALPKMTTSGSEVLPFDADGDGDQDLIVTGRVQPGFYPRAPRSYLLLNEAGKFSDATITMMPELANLGMLTDVQTADLDGNGASEIIVVGDWLPIVVFEREGDRYNKATAKFGLDGTEGWWNTITIADLNGDGRQDIIAGNEGLNSRLRPTAQRPIELFAADFDDNGSIDPIHVFYEGDRLLPITYRASLIKQLPNLKKKYVRTTPYARDDVYEIFGQEALAAADHYEVVTLESAVFYNEPGGFRKVNLPRVVQTSPVQSIVVQDLNNDKQPDLILVGNDYGTEVETGRYDGGNGVILINRGAEAWELLDNVQTGFWASMDARKILPINLSDGNQGLYIANNNFYGGLYLMK